MRSCLEWQSKPLAPSSVTFCRHYMTYLTTRRPLRGIGAVCILVDLRWEGAEVKKCTGNVRATPCAFEVRCGIETSMLLDGGISTDVINVSVVLCMMKGSRVCEETCGMGLQRSVATHPKLEQHVSFEASECSASF